MNSLIKKFQISFKNEGGIKALLKVLRYPHTLVKSYRFKKNVFSLSSIEERFSWIYQNNHWESNESGSGTGSTLIYTENIRKQIPILVSQYSIKKIFDAPCGDFHWMRHLLPELNVDYIGGDVVGSIIDPLNRKFHDQRTSFIQIDLTKSIFPSADLMICRDCLFHLSYADARLLLENFINSDIKYLLTTTHKQKGIYRDFMNRDIQTGDFKLIDLFSSPYNFSDTPLVVIEDWLHPDPERQLCLWSRESVAKALRNFH